MFARGLLRHLTTHIGFEQSAAPDGVPADRRRTLPAERDGDGYCFDPPEPARSGRFAQTWLGGH